MGVWIGCVEFDLLLGDVHSLKQKRAVVRPLVAEIRRRFTVAVAESEHADLHRRSGLAVVAVSGEQRHAAEVLDAVEDVVARRPEVDLLSSHRTFVNTDD